MRTPVLSPAFASGCAALALICVTQLWAQGGSDAPPETLIVDVTVIDGLGGATATHQNVLLRGGRIAAISDQAITTSSTALRIDGRGRYLMPGLWDMHAHTFADTTAMKLSLAAGVTGLRDMGCPQACAKALGSIRQRYLSGGGDYPRIVFAGPMIDGDSPYDDYPSHLQVEMDTLADALAMLRSLKVDFIKARDFLNRDEFMAVIDAGAAMNLPVAGHVPTALSVNDAVRAGISTVEHEGSLFGGLLLACSSEEDQLRAELLEMMREATATGDVAGLYANALDASFIQRLLDSYDRTKAKELVRAFVNSGAALVPTLIVQNPQLRSADPIFNGRHKAADEEFTMAPESLINSWKRTAKTEVLGQPFPPEDLAAMTRQYDFVVRLLGDMHRAGVPLLAGTDAAFPDGTPWIWPGYSLHDELELLVSVGLSPLEAIASATGMAAAHIGLEDGGVIAIGNRADLVLLSRNPAEDIRNTRSIERVWVNGHRVDRDAQLEHVLKRASTHEHYWE